VKHFDERVEQAAFLVELSPGRGRGSLRWTGVDDGKKVVFDSEPYASVWQKLGANLARVLPIDSML
jgi:hypothetical protein